MTSLELVDVARGRDHVRAGVAFGDLRFQFTVWYEDVDFDALARTHGDELVDRLAFHVAMFQANATLSLRPDTVVLGRWARFATKAFQDLWLTVFRHVWAQWRYENDDPDYLGPRFIDPPAAPALPTRVTPGPTSLLAFCGGGKDSLVSLKLLERGALPFATLAYAHSVYGASGPQHALIERVAGSSSRTRRERQWIFDDFLDAPMLGLRPEMHVRTITAAETPASVFAALPLALARGYTGLVVGHEASANAPNLLWNGEPVNHQWGKGSEAERLLDAYVTQELLAGVRYFSVLAPVHDEVIFELLSRDAELAPLTHSCNVQKPWCGRCAKCLYVWLQMKAHLPADVLARTFREDLGEVTANEPVLRELLGLTGHTPFECVGSVPEARLALAQVSRVGAMAPTLSRLAAEIGPLDVPALARPLVALEAQHAMPPSVADRVLPQLHRAAQAAQARLYVTDRRRA